MSSPLPNHLKNMKSLPNIKSKEGMSFYDGMHLLYYFPKKDKNRPIPIKPKDSPFIWDDVPFPPSKWEHFETFQKNNKLLIYIWDFIPGRDICPYVRWPIHERFRELRHELRVFQFLHYKGHFTTILNLQAFYKKVFQLCSRKKVYPCLACRIPYDNEDDLQYHYSHCGQDDWEWQPKVEMPKPGTTIHFRNHSKTLHHPFVAYLDAESSLEPISIEKGQKTLQYQQHRGSTFGFLFIDRIKHKSEYFNFRSVSHLFEIIKSKLEYISSLDFAMTEEKKKSQTHCDYCHQPFTPSNPPVQDHCHFSGKFRGILHQQCNLARRDEYFLPIIAHNMNKYDAHLLVRDLRSINNTSRAKDRFKVIAENYETFVYFQARYQGKNNKMVTAKFLDSIKFLNSSLDDLVKKLPYEKFVYSKKYFKNEFKRKGFFPYDYFTSEKILDKTTKLPPKEYFYNKLNDKHISDEDYQFVQQMWKEFECTTLRDYLENYYLKLDVVLLADVYESFRDFSIQEDHLDPVFYVSFPAFALDSALKSTQQELECLQDQDLYEFFEDAKRGGYCCVHKSYAKANNPKMKTYDESKPTTWILNQDFGNLYGWGGSQSLPVSNFRLNYDINQLNLDKDCYVECDISLPKHLYDKFKDFPLFPEKKDGKLMSTFYPKKNYKVHSKYLKFGLLEGYQLDKVHRFVEFDSKRWLKPSVDICSKKRREAIDEFESNLFKLKVNSVYGKQIQNVRKEIDMYFVDEDSLPKKASEERYDGCMVLDQGQYLVKIGKKKVVLDKPIYGGVTILDLTKMHMADYFYHVLKPTFQDRVELLLTDTDSFIIFVQSEDPYKELEPYFNQWFDTSSLFRDVEKVNFMVPGKMKDEMKGVTITEIAAPREKQYAYKTTNDKPKKKSKGINEQGLKNIGFEDYKKAVFKEHKKSVSTKMNQIQSHNHILYTETVDKIVFNKEEPKIRKRKFLDNIHSVPHGYE